MSHKRIKAAEDVDATEKQDPAEKILHECREKTGEQISDFQLQVFRKLLCVPEGKVTTYGEIAKSLGKSPRAVGGALRRNPYAPAVPCHRVVAADLTLGGFRGCTSGKDLDDKVQLLKSEGVLFCAGDRIIDQASVHRLTSS